MLLVHTTFKGTTSYKQNSRYMLNQQVYQPWINHVDTRYMMIGWKLSFTLSNRNCYSYNFNVTGKTPGTCWYSVHDNLVNINYVLYSTVHFITFNPTFNPTHNKVNFLLIFQYICWQCSCIWYEDIRWLYSVLESFVRNTL